MRGVVDATKSFVAAVARMLSRGEDPPAADLREAVVEQGRTNADLESEIKGMHLERRRILVEGTEADLARHDERVKALQKKLEDGKTRREELAKLAKAAATREEIAELPAKIAELPALLEAERKASAAHERTKAAVAAVASVVSGTITRHSHQHAAELTYPSDAVAETVERVLGEGHKMPREPKGKPKGPPVATYGPDNKWHVNPDATEQQVRQWSQQHQGPSYSPNYSDEPAGGRRSGSGDRAAGQRAAAAYLRLTGGND